MNITYYIKKEITKKFIISNPKLKYFGGHFDLRRYLKMPNADRVSAVCLLKLKALRSKINHKINYSDQKQG